MRKILLKRILRKISITLLWCFILQINASTTYAKSSTTINYSTLKIDFRENNNFKVSTSATNLFADVSGVVKDANGSPIPGVGVKVKGTQNAVSTDGDGKFTLRNVSTGAVIEFTSIGMKTQDVVYNGQTTIQITLLDDATGLNEVIVTAYGGSQKRSSVTAAISQISASEVMKSPTPNPTNALIGKLPGLIAVQTSGQPGADAALLRVRGISTLNAANSAAIVVVDGIERPSFSDVDPNEIETVTVLKDAASTAVYGLKGANGVIVITTKQGKIGKPKVTYTGNYAAQTYTGLAIGLPAYENASLLNLSYRNDGKTAPFSDAEIQKFADKSDPIGYPDVQWFDYLTKKYYSQTQHNIQINGGTKVSKYFVSAGYAFQDGIFKKFPSPYGINTVPNYNRYNFRSNVDLTLNKDFTVGIKLGGRFATRYQPSGLLSSSAFSYDTIEGMISRILQVPAYAYPVTLPDGRITANPNVGTNIWNPYAVLTRFGTRNDDINTIESTFNVNYKLDFVTKGLAFKGNFAYDSYYNNVERRNANWASYVYNPQTGAVTLSTDTRNRDEPLGAVQDGGITTGNTTTNLQAGFTYARVFGKHNVSALALGTRQLIRGVGTTTFTAPPRAAQGVVGNVDYNYDDRYFIGASATYNGSENFAPGLRYGFFPAFSAGYTLTNEHFWNKNKVLSYLKFRGSYGLVGNDQGIGRFLYLTSYNPSGPSVPFGNPSSITNFPTVNLPDANLGNPELTWETGTKRNIGMEARLFTDRLKITADIFDETRKDILLDPLSGSALFGHVYPKLNRGVVYNKGYEVEIDYQGKIGNVLLGINGQVGYAKNRIVENDEPEGLPASQVRKGTTVGQFFGYVNDGFYTSAADIAASPKQQGFNPIPGDLKFKDLDGDGIITTLDQQAIGYSNSPEYIYSFTPRFSYKAFSFSAMFQGAAHVSSNVILSEQNNGQQMYEFMLNSWTPANAATATWPALHSRGTASLNYSNNDYTLQNSAYLKLRNVEISYNLPQSFMKSLKIASARVYLNGQNLYTWTKFKMYVDPENLNVVNQAFPLQALYPSSRVYNIGLQVNF
ncbi:SusC/RagA family TonB-linked outer membrane protein [Pedobacter sp. LMG 31464]|uniref:SusC/RagA family TonB-linked outer membrane protein n=1 Tax=Pedobacter planticolens TaxID=2679964 RepID=A0A923ITD0_9SPHI|nr:TonB-dependent receptor [Pedobacter planticolens]MBB2144600.1 SusC/RagA family TonB-linked outer membrane protein [Pedobacter planticolens]